MNSVMAARETTHGTVGSTFISVPCAFKGKLVQPNRVLEEVRNSQDVNFRTIKAVRHEEFSVAESAIYHDTFGMWLCSAMGLPVSTLVEAGVWDSVFKFTDDPSSLSLKWAQPRRNTQAYQSLNSNVDKLDISFEADGTLSYTASGVGMPESAVANPTYAFSTTEPWAAWAGTVTLGGGAFADLVKGKVSFTRNRKPWWAINNSQDPGKMTIGSRFVEFDLTVDFATTGRYDAFRAATTDSLSITWVDLDQVIGGALAPSLVVSLNAIDYTEAEIDTDADLPQVNLKGRAIYSAGPASKAVLTLRSTRQYQTV